MCELENIRDKADATRRGLIKKVIFVVQMIIFLLFTASKELLSESILQGGLRTAQKRSNSIASDYYNELHNGQAAIIVIL